MGVNICSVPDCESPCHGQGFCRSHYGRWKRHGDPLAGKPPVDPDETHRVCSVCEECKPIDEYSPGGRNRPRCRVCKPCRAAQMRSKYSPEKNREQKLRSKYGITQAEYEALSESQSNLCAICRTRPGGHVLRIDHDHNTGAIRGLLCDWCNTGIGKFRDDPDLLVEASAYLRRDSS